MYLKLSLIYGIFPSVEDKDSHKLDTILELTKENHTMLKKIRSVQKTNQMFRAIYWVFIIATVLGAFYFVKPYFDNILEVYSSLGGLGTKNGLQIPDVSRIQDLINQLK